VYSADNIATQEQARHVVTLQAAGFDVQWVPDISTKVIMSLVDEASHYIAHPLSMEGSFFAMQVHVCTCG